MGVEYRLVKPATGEAYYLGKTAMRPPVSDWKKRMRGIDAMRNFTAMTEVMQPSDHAMWKIGSETDNCALGILSERWTEDALAAQIEIACLQEDDKSVALAIARDVLAWAGQDPVVLIPDSLDVEAIAAKLGVHIQPPYEVRSIYQVMGS